MNPPTLETTNTEVAPPKPSPRRELVTGGVIIALFFGLFMGWAALAPLDAGAYATGQISIAGSRQAVQHREGGIVSTLTVAEGDHVQRGQVLLTLADGELAAAERSLAGQVLSLLAQRARLIAERDGLKTFTPPPEFTSLSPDDLALANEASRLQRLQLNARVASRATQVGVLRQRIGQLDERTHGYQRQLAANLEEQRLIGEELDGLRHLARQGYAPQNRVRALERTAAGLDGQNGALQAQIASTHEQIGETRLQMLGVATGASEEVSDQLRQIEVQLNETRPRLVALREQIERSRIRSPSTGHVVGLNVFTQGGVIQPGQILMEIVPESADHIIVARVNPSDIDNVKMGMETEVRFPGFRERNPPIIHGRIKRLSADSFTDESSGLSHYRAEIVIPPEQMKALGSSAKEIRPGVPVEVIILLHKRTALSYLLEPLTRNLWKSGSEQ